MPTRDTPGRPKPTASRQQTHPDQGTQSGSTEFDASHSPSRQNSKYRDRPADDGKHGDGDQEPNSKPD